MIKRKINKLLLNKKISKKDYSFLHITLIKTEETKILDSMTFSVRDIKAFKDFFDLHFGHDEYFDQNFIDGMQNGFLTFFSDHTHLLSIMNNLYKRNAITISCINFFDVKKFNLNKKQNEKDLNLAFEEGVNIICKHFNISKDLFFFISKIKKNQNNEPDILISSIDKINVYKNLTK